MTKAEIAQKWAEAKDALDVAQAANDAAHEALNAAARVEVEAWGELQRVSGHPIPNPPGAVEGGGQTDTEPAVPPGKLELYRPVYRHSLKQNPIG